MPPKLLTRSQIFEIEIGEDLTLPCEVRNLRDFVILWRKGERIISAGNLLVKKNGRVKLMDNFSLQLINIETGDAGDYFCEVDFYGETQNVTHHVDVLGKII